MLVTLPVSLFNSPFGDSVALMLGHAVLQIFCIWLVLLIVTVALFVLSVRRKHLYCPWLLRPAYLLLKGAVRTGCRMFGIDNSEIITVMIRLENNMNLDTFAVVPVGERAVFLPHCLRSSKCPARLTPDGLKCVSCGRCGIGLVIPPLEDAGYQTFLIPGSTFLKRMVKKYRPQAIIGVGCIVEVKEGLELGKLIHMITLGVVTKTDGCVETMMNWDELLEVASIGLAEPIVLHEPVKKE
mgnify:CR=1 FL=1